MVQEGASRLRIKTLGGLAIKRDGEVVEDFASRKAEGLLVYLTLTRREHPREVLAELLWDDRSQRQAMANLRVVLSSLHKVVGDHVSITRTTAAAVLGSGLWLDARQLEQATALIQKPGGIGSMADAEALAEALALYSGDFLAGFFLPGASGFESWAVGERERLHRLALHALQELGDWHLGQKDYAAAVGSATRLVQVAPLSEAGHRQLMEALARNGQRAEALAQYETCREILAEELGLEPKEGTRELYEAIRSDSLAVLESSDRTDGASRAIRHNLPAQPTPFYGRQTELAELDRLLADPTIRLITIAGVGGAGKTRLAYATAERQLARQARLFGDGIYAISLSSLDGIEQLPPAIASAIDLSLEGPARDSRPGWRQLTDYLQDKEILLVLDNFEHLLQSAELVSELLQRTTSLQVLVTSRERLNLLEEHVFPLAGIGVGDWPTAKNAEGEPSTEGDPSTEDDPSAEGDPIVQLFLHSARRVRPDFELIPEELDQLATLCEITGGLPLALELAASWVEVLPLREIVGEIGQDLDFLQTDLRNVPQRQRSMRAVFEASWRRLDPAQQAAFSRLCLFRGGFTRTAAREVAGASLRHLAVLSAKSLLQYDAARDRYQIHELLRQFGESILRHQPEVQEETRRRHAAFYCHTLHEWEQAWSGAGAGEALSALEREIGNVRLAWKWAVAQRDEHLMTKGLHSLCTYYDRRGYEREAGKLLRAASEALLSRSGNGEADIVRQRLLVRVLTWRSVFSTSFEERLAALEQGQSVLDDLTRQTVDGRREEAFLTYWRGDMQWDAGDQEAARTSFARSRSLYQELDDAAGKALATTARAHLEWHSDNYQEAALLARQALEQQKALGNSSGQADVLSFLGLTEKHRGRLVEAQKLHRESYALLRESGNRARAATAAAALALTLGWSGEFVEAQVIAQEGLKLGDDTGSLRLSTFRRQAAAWVCVHLGRYDEARQHAERAVSLSLAADERQAPPVGWALMSLGQVSLAAASYEEALARLEEAQAVLAETRQSQFVWLLPTTFQGIALCKVGQSKRARSALVEALRENMSRRDFFLVVNALPAAALLVAKQGYLPRALELYALACRYPYVANSRWFEDVMGEDVAAWERALAPDEVQAAKERGRSRDLWETAEELLGEFGDEAS